LRRAEWAPLWRELGPQGARRVIGECLAALRAAPTVEGLENLGAALHAAAARRLQPSLRAVINATGVVLHTNLGRAPLARAAGAARPACRRLAAGVDRRRGTHRGQQQRRRGAAGGAHTGAGTAWRGAGFAGG